jgi:hypothetical protein
LLGLTFGSAAPPNAAQASSDPGATADATAA